MKLLFIDHDQGTWIQGKVHLVTQKKKELSIKWKHAGYQETRCCHLGIFLPFLISWKHTIVYLMFLFHTICLSILCSSWNHNFFPLHNLSLAATPAAFEISWFLPQTFVISSVTMVMGIPTVKRKVKSYLSETLHSLIDKLSPEEKLDCVIIVFVGEVRCPVWDESLNTGKQARRDSLMCWSVLVFADWYWLC